MRFNRTHLVNHSFRLGLSTASFVNEQATAVVSVNGSSVSDFFLLRIEDDFLNDVSFQTSDGVAFHIEGGFAWELEGKNCAGLGYSFCSSLTKTEGMVGPYFGISKSWNRANEHSTSASLTYSFEYTTSDDVEKAGNKSDMFLTPSLNIKFSKSADISFDKAACSAASKEIVSWSLESESNVPVSLHKHCHSIKLLERNFMCFSTDLFMA
jgi:hypothetical protein